MKFKFAKILYFVKGVMPSNEAQQIALKYGPNVAFRNANFVSDNGAPEDCDGVAGDVPKLYKKFKDADEVLKEFNERQAELMKGNAKKETKVAKDPEPEKANPPKKAGWKAN